MANVVQEARQQLRGEWPEWSAPVWRRPSHGPGSRSQSADPPLSSVHLPSQALPVARSASRAGSECLERHDPQQTELAKHTGRLLKPRSCSVSSERSSTSHGGSPDLELNAAEDATSGSSSDELEDELVRLEQELQDKQRELDKVKADGHVLEERLEKTERNAQHFGETAALLEAGLQDASCEEGAPHRELRPAPRTVDPARTQAIDELVDEWSRARAALGLV